MTVQSLRTTSYASTSFDYYCGHADMPASFLFFRAALLIYAADDVIDALPDLSGKVSSVLVQSMLVQSTLGQSMLFHVQSMLVQSMLVQAMLVQSSFLAPPPFRITY